MTRAGRALAMTAALLDVVAADALAQSPGSLRVTIVLYNSQGRIGATIINHTLIVTKAGAPPAPIRLPTRPDGTAEIALEPGTYVLQSERVQPFEGYYHRWNRTFSIAAGETTLVALTNHNAVREPIPPAVPKPPSQPAEPDRVGPITVFRLKYGAPQRMTAGASMLFTIGEVRSEDGLGVARGVEVGASAGEGGWRVEGGAFFAGFPFRTNALLTVTKTSSTPRGATPHATYAGLEVGAAVFPIAGDERAIVLLRPSVGVMHRISGPSGPKRTTFTWGVDAQILMGW